jgi:hypothetical protein
MERDWRTWLTSLFAPWLTNERREPIPFAPHHEEFWQWVWALEKGTRPRPFIAVWNRGGAKSTSAEMAVVQTACARTRRYGLYVCGTQGQADDHVTNVGSLLESDAVAKFYPEVSNRRISKFGYVKGWSQTRLMTASGFTLDAVGLDTAMRGIKVEDQRPDFIILDDIDGELDASGTTKKKITAITKKVIPAGSEDLAVLGVQNLIHADSVFSQLVDGRADMLADRIISGPYPAVDGLVLDQEDQGDGTKRWIITAGEPTWVGFDLVRCQRLLDDIGRDAFMTECQHAVDVVAGGIFDGIEWRHLPAADVPDLVRTVVWVDPAVSTGDDSAAQGLCVVGVDTANIMYVLYSAEHQAPPEVMLREAIQLAVQFSAGTVGVETDMGGDTWKPLYDGAWAALRLEGEIPDGAMKPRFKSAKAGSTSMGKEARAQLMRPDYQDGKIIHVINRDSTHLIAEKALRRFPKIKPLDYVDSQFWAWNDIRSRFSTTLAPVGTTRVSTWMGEGGGG